MIVASIRTASAVPRPDLLDEDDLRRHERADRDAEEERRGGDDSPRALESDRDRLRVGRAAVTRLLDAREEEDAVVGREAERHREQEQGLGGFEAALAVVAEEALEAAVLEDQDEDPEDGAQAEEVHHELLDGEDDRARHEEEDDERHQADHRQHERKVLDQAVLKIDEVRREAGDERVAVEPSERSRPGPGSFVERSLVRDDLDRPGVAFQASAARRPRRRRRASWLPWQRARADAPEPSK